MGWKAQLRAYEAAQRREEREAAKRKKELERQRKEQAKLSQMEQAKLEFEAYENEIDLLQSIHKEQGESWDWLSVLCMMPAPPPKLMAYHELRAKQNSAIAPPYEKNKANIPSVELARQQDDREFQEATQTYAQEMAELAKLRSLARRILDGDTNAYKEAVTNFNPFSEIYTMGSKLRLAFHSATLLIAEVKVKGTDVIPPEAKSLTSTGKLSIKKMPTKRFHELYQDCICSCILRIARESFALLPVTTVLVTATTDAIDQATGQEIEQPVLSVAIQKESMRHLEFDRLDPSDTIDTFLHRGDFKASRKAGAFGAIVPLTPAQLPVQPDTTYSIKDLLPRAKALREELAKELNSLKT